MKTPHPANTRALRLLAGPPALLAGLFASVLWASEPWQRPLWLGRVSDGPWLALAIACFVAGAAAMPWAGRWRWATRVSAAILLCAGVPYVAMQMQREAAVTSLLEHQEVLRVTDPGLARPATHESWFEGFMDFLDRDVLPRVGIDRGASSSSGLITTEPPDPYDHLLETCRWPTRRAFLREVFAEDTRLRLATHDWHRLLPAMTGQDVSLAHRTELMDWLAGIANESSPSAAARRDAAAFWMALIVLTDAEAFATHAERTLALMHASDDPPIGATGDAWMRAFDLLLAMMPDSRHAELTAAFARKPKLLRRATRERVRGMVHHAAAIMEEIRSLDEGGRHQTAAAMWLDLMRLADASADESTRRDIHESLAAMLGYWLLGDSTVVGECQLWKILIQHGPPAFETLAGSIPPDLPLMLRTRAHAALDAVMKPQETHHNTAREFEIPMEIFHALIIASLLGDEERRAIHNRAAIVIARTIHDPGLRQFWHTTSLFDAMNLILDSLDDGEREILRDSLIVYHLSDPGRAMRYGIFGHALVALDLACASPVLTGAERVALTMHRLPVADAPSHSADAVAEFIDLLLSDEEPEFLGHLFHRLRARLTRRHRGDHVQRPDHERSDLHRFNAFRDGLVGPEHLPADWPGFVHAIGASIFVRIMNPDREAWEPLLRDPLLARLLLNEIDSEPLDRFPGFFGYLAIHSPEPDIRRLIVELFMSQAEAPDREARIGAFQVLLAFSDWLEMDERAAFRARLARFLREENLGSDVFRLQNPMAIPPWLLAEATIPGGGPISWEDDALSAEHSWRSHIRDEFWLPALTSDDESGVFRHLHVSGAEYSLGWYVTDIEIRPYPLDQMAPTSAFSARAPSPPFVATAWQRARELHERQPDLMFPDRPRFVPRGDRVRFADEYSY